MSITEPRGESNAGDLATASAQAKAASQRMFSSLGLHHFRMLWFGMLFNSAAMQMNLIARPWLAYQLSHSGLSVGAVAAARALPQLFLAPLGGVAADRYDKRSVLLVSQAGLSALALVNAVLVHLHVITIWQLILIGVGQGVIFPFTMPARQAFIPALVGKDRMANALAIDSSGRNLNKVVTPAIGGLLLAWHPTVAFYAIAVAYLAAVATLRRIPHGPPEEGTLRGPFRHELTTGFRYIYQRPVLLTLVGMGFLVVGLGLPFQQLLPIFQSAVLKVGPRALGIMYTALGVGGLAGSLAIAYVSESPRWMMLQILAGAVLGVGLTFFGMSTSYSLSLLLLFVAGMASQAYLTLNRVTVLANTEPGLYGRVMSIYAMTWAIAPLAVLPMGGLIDVIGPQATVAGSGVLLVAIVVAIAGASWSLWRPRPVPL
jgi:MFS family permease